jgi:hypothetical protein
MMTTFTIVAIMDLVDSNRDHGFRQIGDSKRATVFGGDGFRSLSHSQRSASGVRDRTKAIGDIGERANAGFWQTLDGFRRKRASLGKCRSHDGTGRGQSAVLCCAHTTDAFMPAQSVFDRLRYSNPCYL